jgi:hypothetical protein
MCAPRVTRHISIRYSSSCHIRFNMGVSIFFTAAMIRAFRSARSRGDGSSRRLHEMHVAQKPQAYICDIPTDKTTSPPERPCSHYIHSHRLAAEMWTTMKNDFLGKKLLSCSFYLYRFRKYLSYGFPIIIFFVIPEYIMKRPVLNMPFITA